ncbi:hypothetical protein BS50DRAFT_586805 [Corynespora cassiicola Philippines]|uniref:Uncharacterized protein n=1 Tax=Corynespora cassiicola Philippines TaxID=1448308 RepID=A0A2T2NVQ2_CORCC|nr:hypothetical protein BS50DRAFT_586805 [Corynespora cassiicola Philippines]
MSFLAWPPPLFLALPIGASLHLRNHHPPPSALPLHMALWQWYRGIAPKTRIVIGVGVMAYAGLGMFLSDRAEEHLGLVPTEKDKEELRKAIPTITPVERNNR